MHNESPDRLFDPAVDDLNHQWSPIESRIRSSLFDSDTPARPDWLLELASADGPESSNADSDASADSAAAYFSAEDELSRFADNLPPVRLSLRYEFLAELDRLDQKRDRVRRVTATVAFLFVVGVSSVVPLLSASAQPVSQPVLKDRSSSRLDILRGGGPVPPLVAENSPTDSWAMVDAYNEFESERRDRLRRGLTTDLFTDQKLLARPQR